MSADMPMPQGKMFNRSLQSPVSRRQLLQQCSTGFGALALTGLMNDRSYAALPAQAALEQPHHAPKAKHVIFCFMSGGVSHVDSFDPKPKLKQFHGKSMPVRIERTQFNQNGNVMASPFTFTPSGESGIPVSSMFPDRGDPFDDHSGKRTCSGKFCGSLGVSVHGTSERWCLVQLWAGDGEPESARLRRVAKW